MSQRASASGRASAGRDVRTSPIVVAGVTMLADCGGALFWPDEGLLVIADLHLEKGSGFAKRGVLLPPYDTAATFARLSDLIARYAPRVVVALGDSFDDGEGPVRLSDSNRAELCELQRGRDWIWIAGNHDPDPMCAIGGNFVEFLQIGRIVFRHLPGPISNFGEIAGHLHPVARVVQRGRCVGRRCFASDGRRIVMPAFGAYAGGLNVRDRAFARIFDGSGFVVHMLGEVRLYAFPAKRCVPN
jgi:DNA ligase-associated metallophosphoesterase